MALHSDSNRSFLVFFSEAGSDNYFKKNLGELGKLGLGWVSYFMGILEVRTLLRWPRKNYKSDYTMFPLRSTSNRPPVHLVSQSNLENIDTCKHKTRTPLSGFGGIT